MEQTAEIEQKTKVIFQKGRDRVMLYESDRDVDMDEIAEYCEVNDWPVPEENSSKYCDMVHQCREFDWEVFMDNCKYSKVFPKKVVVTGSAGLWDGRRTIVPTICDTADLKKFWGKFVPSGACYEYRVGYDRKGGLFVEVPHHDGTNFYYLRELTEKGQRYVDRCEEQYADPEKAGDAPYSRKIDWWLY